MTNNILVFTGMPGGWEWLVILIILGIPVLLIILFVKYLARNNKERQRLRLEMGKLADELELIRKQAEGGKKGNSSDQSG